VGHCLREAGAVSSNLLTLTIYLNIYRSTVRGVLGHAETGSNSTHLLDLLIGEYNQSYFLHFVGHDRHEATVTRKLYSYIIPSR